MFASCHRNQVHVIRLFFTCSCVRNSLRCKTSIRWYYSQSHNYLAQVALNAAHKYGSLILLHFCCSQIPQSNLEVSQDGHSEQQPALLSSQPAFSMKQ